MRLETGDNKDCFHAEKPWGKTCDLCRYRRALDLIMQLSMNGMSSPRKMLKIADIASTALWDQLSKEIDGRRLP